MQRATVRGRCVRARILASWSWARLDREIADGPQVEQTEARLLRAEQLLVPEERHRIAAVLRNLLDAAESAGAHRERERAAAIVASRERLVRLIELLRSDMPMPPSALARAELLACDRSSPLVVPRGAPAIADALDQIDAAMRT